MTWTVICPRCQRPSLRHACGDVKPVCQHEYHAAEDCGVCGECRTGWRPEHVAAPLSFRALAFEWLWP